MAKTPEELEAEVTACQEQIAAMTVSSQSMAVKLAELEAKEQPDDPRIAELEARQAAQAARLEETRGKVKRARTLLAKLRPLARNADDPPAPGPSDPPKKKQTHSGIDWI